MTRLKWTTVERGCAAVAEVAFIYPLYLAGLLYVLGRDDRDLLVDVSFLQEQIPVFLAVSAGAFLLLGWGLVLRHRRPGSLLFQHLAANYFGLALVWAGYLTGTLNFATGVVLMGAAVTGYIVLDRRVILPAFIVAFSSVFGFNVAAAMELIPYAPAFVAPHDAHTHLFWLHATFFLAAPHILFCIIATLVMLAQWRRREARVLRLGITDMLTGLYNRRCILEILNREEDRARNGNRPLAVALLDLDHFKAINDERGHLVGDRVLSRVADCLRRELGDGNDAGRFGGEEFLCVLPGMTAEQAQQRLEQCRRSLEALDIRDDEGAPVPVSGSFGLAWHEGGPGVNGDALVKAADEALYQAKRDGRNRVERASSSAVMESTVQPSRHRTIGTLPAAPEDPSPRAREWLRRRITGVRDLSETAMSALMLGLISLQYLGYLVWGLYVLQRDDREQLANVVFGQDILPVLVIVIGAGLLLTLVGYLLARRHTESYVYTWLSHQFYALTLVGFGYLVGLMSLPTGIVMLGTPLVGLMFFRRALVIGGFSVALVMLTLISYASAVGFIPYAPLVPMGSVHFRAADPFWVASFYYFVVPILLFVLIILDQVLGFWRQRGQYIQVLSMTDPLTRVHNRRNIMDILAKGMTQVREQGMPLSVVLVDIDHFKVINDRRGHPVGDRVLRQIAETLAEEVRDDDSVGRYGGEEFLMVLPGTSLSGAMKLAERCRQRLAGLDMVDDAGAPLRVTGSFGVAALDPVTDTGVDSLIKRADDALYRAKDGGRDRIETLEPPATAL